MKTIPLCLNCKQPVDELSLCLEGDDVYHCQNCKFVYTEKSEPLPEGMHIWEENALGEKRNEHVWWSGHKSELCEKGQYVQTIRKGRGYHKKIEGQCRDCKAVYQHIGPLSFQHASEAWIIPTENRRFIWFPDCNHCRGGIENWYTQTSHASSCDKYVKRFELWVIENDQDNIKYRISSWNDITDYAERKNKTTGEKEVILVRKKQNKVSLRMEYQFSDGHQTTIRFWKEGEKYGEWDHVFKKHADAEEYVLEKTKCNIRNFWM